MARARGSLRLVLLLGMALQGTLRAAETDKAAEAFESVYGAELRRVKGTAATGDDLELATRLLAAAKKATDQPAFLTIVCERASDLAGRHPDGASTAVEAMQFLAARVPDKAAACAERVVGIRQKQFDRSRGPDRSSAGEALIDALLALIDMRVGAGAEADAALLYRKALAVARTVESARLDEIEARQMKLVETMKTAREIADAKAMLKADPQNRAAREALVRLHLVNLDDPVAAPTYLEGVRDGALRKYVPAAAKPVEDAPELACLELGRWYRTLAETAPAGAKAAMLVRAEVYYERFLELHTVKDLDRTAATLALEQIQAAVGTSGGTTRTPGKWIDLLKLVNPEKDTVAGRWTAKATGLQVLPSAYARLMLPIVPDGSYELAVRFWRVAGGETLVVHLPAGTSPVTAVLAAKGGYYGLETINGKGVRENATTQRLGSLRSAREHVLAVKVVPEGDDVAVRVALDGRAITNWKGPQSALSVHTCWAMPNRKALGLCTYGSHVLFKSVRLRMLSGKASPLRPKGSATGSRPAAKEPRKTAQFRPGEVWPDNRGVPINAHGGGILFHQGTYFWFGEHRTEGSAGNRSHVGVHCSSSRDLYNWQDEGIALRNSDDPDHELAKGCVLQRPKVIYNAATGRFVMWFHLEFKGQGYQTARSAVAVADKVTGPYNYIGSFRPDGQGARDMTLFVDDDGKAYQFYASEGNRTLHIGRLRDDYLRPSGEYERAFVGRMMEAPAVCKRKGKYYALLRFKDS